jgi:hypothetical protein
MNFAESCKEDLVYHGWAEWLPVKKRKAMLFDRTIISMGRRSKEKWRKIVDGGASDHGVEDCAYCACFHKSEEFGCPGCPIELFTKGARCIATPYYTYIGCPTVPNAMAMKNFIDEIFIRSLLLIDWRKYYAMSGM